MPPENLVPPTGSTGGHSDPTELTTRQLISAIANVRDLNTAEQRAIIVRLDAVDAAAKLAVQRLTDIPTDTDKQIATLKSYIVDVFSEKLKGVSEQLIANKDLVNSQVANMEKFSAALRQAADTAIAAAFAAADKVIAAQNSANADASRQANASFTERVKAVENLLNSTKETNAVDSSAMKDRLTKLETERVSIRDTRTDNRQDGMYNVAIIGGMIGFLAFIGTIIALALKLR